MAVEPGLGSRELTVTDTMSENEDKRFFFRSDVEMEELMLAARENEEIGGVGFLVGFLFGFLVGFLVGFFVRICEGGREACISDLDVFFDSAKKNNITKTRNLRIIFFTRLSLTKV